MNNATTRIFLPIEATEQHRTEYEALGLSSEEVEWLAQMHMKQDGARNE